jgi:hypothetical protein
VAGGSLGAAMRLSSEAYRDLREALVGLLERVDGLDPMGRMEAAETLEQSDDAALLLTTLRSLLRDVAALRAGASAGTLVNPDLADRLLPLARGPLGARAIRLAEDASQARSALRGFSSRLLTFDVLVDALARD